MKKFLRSLIITSLGLFLGTAHLHAQTYPNKPVRVVVPFPAGGIVDILTRAVTEKVASNWGVPIIVEAKPGAGALIGTEAVANAPADGYTFLVATITTAVGPLINPQFKYDLRKDFAAVAMFATAPNIAVVPPSLPVSNMSELVELAKKNPGKFNYAHTGVGSTNHLPVEFLKFSRQLYIVPITYRGQPQAITDVLAGQIQLFMGAPALLVPHVKAGKLKAIAVTSSRRLEDTPQVQTLTESGFGDVQGGSGWFGIVAPAGTPPAILKRFNEEINAALKAPEVIERLRKAYAFPEGGTAEDFTKFLNDEGARWTKLVKEANLKIE
ncbi:Bug family tripartite tricarboxylate transporter substrate binding protein [Limnohabitans sp.]|jgi:tripartite-type tricarboxylate transporter receptor subunit TctC|uniref:Bug family tripartite tricarboxylate transporter substrate binding protein n=1 Tax=Limnohabitans sp. TaxID=1907725 RepID=UPI0037BE6041